MENNRKHRNGDKNMECDHMCHGHWGQHGLIWITIKIVVLLVVFWFGFKVGQVSNYIGSYYGYGGMRGGYYNMMGPGGYGGYGPWMMNGYYGPGEQQPASTTQK